MRLHRFKRKEGERLDVALTTDLLLILGAPGFLAALFAAFYMPKRDIDRGVIGFTVASVLYLALILCIHAVNLNTFF